MDENYSSAETRGIAQNVNVKNKIISAARNLANKLNEEIAKGNDTGAFMIALLLAAFKDFIDIVLAALAVGEIPGVNFAVGLFLTSFLFFFMLGKGWFLKWKIKFWFWFLGLFIDGLPVVGVLPMNVLLVLYAWRLAKKRKKHAEEKLVELSSMTDVQVNELNGDISLLENTKYMAKSAKKQPSKKGAGASQTANFIPFAGGIKMMGESLAGKDMDGHKISGKDRATHGLAGAGSLALDFIGIGEVEKGAIIAGKSVGMVEKMGVRAGEMGGKRTGTMLNNAAKFMGDNPELTRRGERFVDRKIVNHLDTQKSKTRNESNEEKAA